MLQRGQYQRLANPLSLKLDPKLPLELYEARNAVQIARGMGADRFATKTFAKAEKSLAAAEAYQQRKAGRKPVTMTAREAVQTAEDARAIAVKRQEEMALAAERQQSADREGRAETARATAQADADRPAREKDVQTAAALAEADRLKRDSDSKLAAAASDAARLQLENESRASAARNEADRLRLENDSPLAAAEAESNRLKRDNEAQSAAALAALNEASKQKAHLEAEKAELRTQLLKRFNAILEARDSARGLIVMSDVLFDTGKYSLRPAARENLAKVAGIISGHPGLRLDVEGHTESVGGDSYNHTLSEQRGAAVRDYLAQGELGGGSVTSKGLGETQPVASNDNAAGRQQNRRVEIVTSGEVIGAAIGIPVASRE